MRTPPESAKPDSWGERALEAGWAASAVSVMGLGGHAALHGPDGLGGELLPADRPVAALRLLDVHPGDSAHALALDVDHRIGELLDHLALLLGVEDAFDELDIDDGHGSSQRK